MPTKEDLEDRLDAEQRKVQVLTKLVQQLLRKTAGLHEDVQTYVTSANQQFSQIEADNDE